MNTILANRIADKILNEQGSMGGALSPMFSYNMGITNKDRLEFASTFWRDHKHDIMAAASIAALFIPIPGVNVALAATLQAAASTAFALADAKMYWDEGNRYMALSMTAFALMPGSGAIVSRIPGVKQLGAAGMAKLAKLLFKAKKGVKVAFTKLQRLVIKGLSKEKKLVAHETAKKSIEIGKKIANSKAAKVTGKVTGKVARGTAKVASYGAASTALTQYVVDPIYTAAGFDTADIEDGNRGDLDALVALNKKMK
jgi:hypothetical protein